MDERAREASRRRDGPSLLRYRVQQGADRAVLALASRMGWGPAVEYCAADMNQPGDPAWSAEPWALGTVESVVAPTDVYGAGVRHQQASYLRVAGDVGVALARGKLVDPVAWVLDVLAAFPEIPRPPCWTECEARLRAAAGRIFREGAYPMDGSIRDAFRTANESNAPGIIERWMATCLMDLASLMDFAKLHAPDKVRWVSLRAAEAVQRAYSIPSRDRDRGRSPFQVAFGATWPYDGPESVNGEPAIPTVMWRPEREHRRRLAMLALARAAVGPELYDLLNRG